MLVSIDEHRVDYDACVWTPEVKPEQSLQQRWFLGAHCDIGGGYEDRRLSDLALRWMQDNAAAAGLSVDPVTIMLLVRLSSATRVWMNPSEPAQRRSRL